MNVCSSSASLLRAIATRLAGIAVGLIILMIVVTVAEYAGNAEKLRRATLEDQAEEVFEALHSGRSAKFTEYCNRYPNAYGYRIFDDKNQIINQLNGGLFPEMPRYRSGRPDLSFKHQYTSDPLTDQWFATLQGEVAGQRLWIHITMIGDPAGLWSEILLEEIAEHVIVPSAFVLPPLALAIFWALRSALKPLTSIAKQARCLALEITAGTLLNALDAEGLPREAQDLVGALNFLLHKYEEMLERQKQFTANAAHELRTPLAVLQLQISRLPLGEVVDRLNADVAVMTHTVNQLLLLSQAEQLAKAGFSPADLREIARAACEEMAVPAVAQGLSIEFDEAPAPVMTSCNSEFIAIAIRNIIENALRATPTGSVVSVVVNAERCIAISDRGPGIPLADRDSIFQRFWSKHRGEGVGIGLALVRRIMDLHSGDVLVEDREGGGARVVLWFGPNASSRGFGQTRRLSSFCGRV